MNKIYRVLTALLLSFVIVASIIMFTVGVEQSHLGSERKWMYPLVFVLIPAFALQAGIRFLFRRKIQSINVMKKSPTSKGGNPTGEA
jgi:cbb3-type cytochrome oxidase subunit 1